MTRWLKTRLLSLLRRDRLEQDLDRELAFHLDMLTEQNLRAGMPALEARRLALRHFGKVEGVKEAVRDTWLSRAAETLRQDVRYGVRNLRRNPGFGFVVVLTMALGIGANTAIFSVVNGVLLRPLPYADDQRLVVLHQQLPLAGGDDLGFSYKELQDYRTQAPSLEGVAEFHEMWFILLGRPEPQRVSTGVVSANFFAVLGLKPLLGRDFVAGDEHPGAPAVLMLSHRYWQEAFGGDPRVVGRVFQMNDRPHQVVGVLPAAMQYPSDVDVYMPTSACPFRSSPETIARRDSRMSQAFARVRTGVSVEAARVEIADVAARMHRDHPQIYPANLEFRTQVIPLREELTRSFRTTLLVLLGTATLILLIVCASVANLTLARLVQREREMAVRAALGATRRRLLRQLLTESTVLALFGGVAGLVIAFSGVDLLAAFAERFTQRAADIRIDRAVLLYTLAVSLATGLIFGSVPALVARFSPAPPLREGSRTTHASHTVRSSLIVVQVAVSFMLLVGAGLTIRTLFELQQVDPGYRTDSIMTMRVDLDFTKYDDAQYERAPFWETLEDRLRAIPGVVSVGGAGTFPLNDRGPFSRSIVIEGHEPPAGAPRPQVDVRIVSPDYFTTLGQPLLSGRVFSRRDRFGEPPVIIVSRRMAEHYWPGDDAIGRRVGDGEDWFTVVGVVADARQQLHQSPGDEIYVPMFQSGQLSSNWLVRTSLDPPAIIRQVRDTLRLLDPGQPVDQFRTLAEIRLASLESPRLTATLLGLFAALALVITAAGIAGVIAFSVNQRTQEFGIRRALGAGRATVLRLVLREGLQLVLVGLAIGAAGAMLLARVMTTLLFGVEPTDALTFVSVAMMLVAVALVACFVPAHRAASVDPMIALRADS
jgi:predicted permease